MIQVTDQLIPIDHPNRWGWKLVKPLAITVHFTGNDRPGSDDAFTGRYFSRPYIGTKEQPLESDGITPFAYGSAHFGCDDNSITRYIPEDEVAWHNGENAWLPKDNGFDGRQAVAKHLFHDLPNNYTIGIEICNNRDSNWEKACENAIALIHDYAYRHELVIDRDKCLSPQNVYSLQDNEILILRHYDVTGKHCPGPMVDDYNAWVHFLNVVSP
jgi:N-acetylmuramoyl-L-alanine amidase CwlA